jgi:DNA-binding Lrp family transcriptional regulator
MKKPLKDVELRLISELMKNSRRSDRGLAKIIGVSQPTITRTRVKLEKSGVIREYTMIPDFSVLGFEIMAHTRFELDEKPFEDRAKTRETMIDKYPAVIAVEGISDKRNRLFVNFYRSYSEYAEAISLLKSIPIINAADIDTFLVDLTDKRSHRFLSMSAMADNLPNLKKEESKP